MDEMTIQRAQYVTVKVKLGVVLEMEKKKREMLEIGLI